MSTALSPEAAGRPTAASSARVGIRAGGSHIPALDGVRGLAILMVMFFHLYHVPHGAARVWVMGTKVSSFGQSGVDLFFVLSGFLITGILLDAKPTAHYFRNFYARRTLRIFPLYYLVLVAAAVATVLIPNSPVHLPHGWAQLSLWLYVCNIPMALWGLDAPGLTHFWSLAVEEQFYLVWPAVVRFCSVRTIRVITIVAFFVALALRWWFAHPGTEAGAHAAFYFTLCRVDALAVGALLATFFRSELAMSRVRAWRTSVLIAAVVLAGASWVVLPKGDTGLGVIFKHSILALLFGAVLCVAADVHADTVLRRVFEQRWLRLLGKYSYGLYVYHGVFGYLFGTLMPIGTLAEKLNGAAAAIVVHLVVGMIVSFLVAYLSWHLYEAQWLKLKKYFEYREPRVANPTPET
jgi:peptidoglycan/LPS O-acetylase OafA/YrhL